MSGQQLALTIGEPRATPVAVWESLPNGSQVLVVTTLAGLVARMLEAERDE